MSDDRITRRAALGITAGVLVGGVAACSSSSSNTKRDGLIVDGRNGSDAPGSDAASCKVYTQQTEGPYYLDKALDRKDITEGKQGTALELTIRALDAAGGCAPLSGIIVDIWHCDADGVYSGYPGQLGNLDTTGKTFLRGSQSTDSKGEATFTTIYPGWYPGRTTHIHFKVHKTATAEATSQLYFPEDINSAVYKTGVYAARGDKDTANSADGIATSGGKEQAPLVTLEKSGSGYKGLLVVVVA
ncbi:MAG: intradiol ring-cleavage dioxygenase [Myxococcales bacterium]|nr:intradiol ring-cleavage dioxygenase [Myxococcales bacterium]